VSYIFLLKCTHVSTHHVGSRSPIGLHALFTAGLSSDDMIWLWFSRITCCVDEYFAFGCQKYTFTLHIVDYITIMRLFYVPYLSNGLTDRHKIWHADAVWRSWTLKPLKLPHLENPRWQTVAILTNKKIAICAMVWPITTKFCMMTHTDAQNHTWSLKPTC